MRRKLWDDLTSANAEAKRRKLQSRKLAEELKNVQAERDRLLKELGTLQKDPNELSQEVTRLRETLRSKDHRAAFDKVCKDKGVRDEALNDLWSLSGYKAETDVPDPGALEQSVSEVLSTRPYLLADKASEQTAPKQYQAGPGLSKGSMVDALMYTVHSADCQNPSFMRTHGAKIAEHSAAGTLRFVD